ncbi:MAG: PAS domain S-box protein [Armatimonadota bacterium]|nr:PAS domain S-box protein [Armatimonadota bacterium]MDR7467345.1 PAS domain S-box protein [Armatimonadota bacterium]MDR7494115.1 PAS domain S-box protein [Armatimonadota bacterium]MDR7504372.1 PAS domain S-box protein [Armatimonadota bacterium]MDR7547965.1 PAS domain S-box protein [Armatimonadota bacterium]
MTRREGPSGHDLFALLRHHPVPVWLCDPGTLGILAANDAAAAASGHSDAELRTRTLTDLCPEDERDGLRAQLQRSRATRSGPWHLRRPEGGTVIVELTTHPAVVDRRRLLLVMAWDVTAARRLEEELHRREAELRATLYSIGDAVISTDARGTVAVMNPVAERLTGWPEGEARGRPLDQVVRIVNEESRLAVEDPVARILREGVVIGLGNHSLLLSRDGREYSIADAGAPIRDREGRLTGVVLVFRDQTEERRNRRAAEEARALAEGIVATAREALLVLDAALRVVVANRTFCRLFQVSLEETVGWLVYELGTGQWDIPALRRLLEEILPLNTAFEDFEVGHDFPQIGRRTMLLNARRLYHETAGTRLILLAIEDVTERRRAEEELRRRLRELEALHRVSAALRAAQTVEEALPVLLDETLAVFDTDSGSIMLYRPEDQRLHAVVLRGSARSMTPRSPPARASPEPCSPPAVHTARPTSPETPCCPRRRPAFPRAGAASPSPSGRRPTPSASYSSPCRRPGRRAPKMWPW